MQRYNKIFNVIYFFFDVFWNGYLIRCNASYLHNPSQSKKIFLNKVEEKTFI